MRRKFSSVQKNFLLQELSKSFNSPEEKNPEEIYGVKKEPAVEGEKCLILCVIMETSLSFAAALSPTSLSHPYSYSDSIKMDF